MESKAISSEENLLINEYVVDIKGIPRSYVHSADLTASMF